MSPALSALGLVLGLAVFLAGARRLMAACDELASTRAKKWIQALSGTGITAAISGCAAAAAVHSSSAVTVIAMGLVRSGVLSLSRGFCVIVGANVGTTVTAQIAATDLGYGMWVLLGIGALLAVLLRGRAGRLAGRILFSTGVLMAGLWAMSASAAPMARSDIVRLLILFLGASPLSAAAAGAVLTGMIQSSTAVTGIVLALARQGLMDLPGAVGVVLGANVGTCVTGLIASVGAGKDARAVAWANLWFNVLGCAAALALFERFILLVTLFGGGLPRQVANAHTAFNVLTAAAVLPVAGPFMGLFARGDRGSFWGRTMAWKQFRR